MNYEIQIKSLQALESLLDRGIISVSEVRSMLGLKAEKTSEYIIKDMEVAQAIGRMIVEAGVDENTADKIVARHMKDKRTTDTAAKLEVRLSEGLEASFLGKGPANAETAAVDDKSSDLTKQINESLAWITPANTETDADAELNAKEVGRMAATGRLRMSSRTVDVPVSEFLTAELDLEDGKVKSHIFTPKGKDCIPLYICKLPNGKVVVSIFNIFK